MRVLHLSTSVTGGAGLSALRLHEASNRYGIDSYLYTNSFRLHDKPESKILEVRGSKKERIVSGLIQKTLNISTDKDFGFISPISASRIDYSLIKRIKPDLLHIHNWYNLISEDDFKDLSRIYPIAITLHDARSFTGGCHVTLNCENFMKVSNPCNPCNANRVMSKIVNNSRLKMDKFLNNSQVRYIAPSRWIREELIKARPNIPGEFVSVIPNIIPVIGERSERSETSERNLNFLFVSANVNAPFKGLLLGLSALEKYVEAFKPSINVTLTIVGQNTYSEKKSKFLKLNYVGVKNTKEVLQIMGNCDFLIVPSLSENSPAVITEAQMVGIPVIATRIGGNSEQIEHLKTGYLSEPNPEALAKVIEVASTTANKVLIKNARNFSVKRSCEKNLIASHLSVYEDMVKLK